MEILFQNKDCRLPKVSIVLLDWSCRESLHLLHYLSKQTISRDQYEVIWIEYYNRRAPQIEQGLKEYAISGIPPIVDQWAVMDIPKNVYYHKHLMYNVGIVISRGMIVTLCDSDAIVKDTFVETVIRSFEKDPNIVLHLDQVRNNDKRFYPFNYPTIEEIIGEGSINWENGKTKGLWDTEDTLHTRNYGACMAALREDLIAIGGADEHIDYLGHICGPYDMTFRLINSGKKEIWHSEEFLYHVWHPGQAGDNNYLGPHDGRHMSTTALETRLTGRVFPIVENPAVKMMRGNQNYLSSALLFSQVISAEKLIEWTIENLKKKKSSPWRERLFLRRPVVGLLLFKTFLKMLVKQFYLKATKFSRQAKTMKDVWTKIAKAYDFLKNMSQYNIYVIKRSRHCLNQLASQRIKEVSVYGAGDVAEVLYDLTFEVPVKINAIYDDFKTKKFLGFDVFPIETSCGRKEKVIIASLIGVEDKIEKLKKSGIEPERIVVLQ